VPLLLKTLFMPFRQISAGESGKSLSERAEVVLDKLFSRAIGAFMRTILIFVGIFAMIFALIFGLAKALIWPFFPLLPVAGIVLSLTVGAPWLG
jgi:hypothetical protein